jgi:hypothetical protein
MSDEFFDVVTCEPCGWVSVMTGDRDGCPKCGGEIDYDVMTSYQYYAYGR